MQNEMRRAYSYIRFSSPEQAKGDSYRRQIEAAKLYCEKNGLIWADTNDYLFFDKGRSAFKGRHLDHDGALARFISYVDDGTIAPGSILIVESFDRLSRERVIEALPRFIALLSKGIDIYTTSDQKLYTKDVQDYELFISIMHMGRAHNESSLKGERVSLAWKNKQSEARLNKKPLGKACPYWLIYDGEQYKVVEERAIAIGRIFDFAIAGYGHRAIAKILNSEGVPVFGSDRRNKSGLWGSSSTSKILSNRALIGEYQPTGLVNGVRKEIGDPVENFYPVVVSEDKFYEAQSARTTRKVSKATKASANFNVWQGLAKCQFCGESMHLVNKGRPPKGGKYLRCYRAAKGRCQNKSVPLVQSERIFMEILAKVDSLSLIQDSQSKIQKEMFAIESRLEGARAKLSELERQILELEESIPQLALISAAKFEREIKELSAKREELKQSMQREKILNKYEFFEKLDLVSYDARAKANYLLKALNVRVDVSREGGRTGYAILLDGATSFMILQEGSEAKFLPLSEKAIEVVHDHGDEEDYLKAREEYNAWLPKVYGDIKQNPVLAKFFK